MILPALELVPEEQVNRQVPKSVYHSFLATYKGVNPLDSIKKDQAYQPDLFLVTLRSIFDAASFDSAPTPSLVAKSIFSSSSKSYSL